MMRGIKIILSVILCCAVSVISAQRSGDLNTGTTIDDIPEIAEKKSAKWEKADHYFEELAFRKAIKLYLDVERENADPGVRLKLADSYRLINNYRNAEYWYEQLVLIDTIDPLNKFYYAQALMANEKYNQARIWFEEYSHLRPGDPRGRNLADAAARTEELIANSYPCELQNMDLNTSRSEFGPSFYGGDGLLFTSDRDTIFGIRRTNDWFNAPFLNLYVDRGKGNARKLKGDVNGRFHEGPAVVTRDMQTMYITRSNYAGGGFTANESLSGEGLVKLKIFKAAYAGGDKWNLTSETAFPFNNDEYSVSHPALSEDGMTLFFASDMPGGYGGVDLYKADLLADGESWSEARNLGPLINTAGNEMFPFIHPDGAFFFASDGHPGLGGLDVFETRYEDGRWQLPKNMGKPMNSSKDDFGLIFNDNMNTGYVVSNRFGGKGSDDIYSVKNTGIELKGEVYDEFTGRKVAGAQVRLRERKLVRSKTESDSRGGYSFNVSSGHTYEVVVDKPGYRRKIVRAEVGDLKYPSEFKVDIALEDTLLLKLVVQVIDKESRSPLGNSRVMIYSKCSNENNELPTDENGILRVRLEPNCTFYIAGRSNGFLDDNDVVSTNGITESKELASVLELTEIKEDLVIELKNIYYDYGRYYIREDAVADLDNLAGLMDQYSSLKIEISSHTDSRGSDETNHKLSQRRAETCVDYLISKGVQRDRLVARGYGEYVLKNNCSNGVSCSEEQHQINRRTEFKVLSFDQVLYSDDVENPAVNIYKKVFGDDEVVRTKEKEAETPSIVFVQKDNAEENINSSTSGLLDKQSNASRDMVSSIGAEEGAKTAEVIKPKAEVKPVKPPSVITKPDPVVETVQEPSDPVSTGEAVDLNDVVAGKENQNSGAADKGWWSKGVAYSVQIAFGSSNTDLYRRHADLGPIRLEYTTGGTPVVIIGYFMKFSEANSAQAILRSRGVSEAFIISYVDGERLE